VVSITALAVPVGALALYLYLGSPELPNRPLAERQGENTQAAASAEELTKLSESLAARLRDDPDDRRGWALLARSYRALGRFRESADALAKLVELSGGPSEAPPDMLSDYGEILVAAGGGTVTPAAVQILETAVARSADQPRARHYLAVARFQAGDLRDALAMWRSLEADSPPDAPWMELLRERIAKTAESLGVDPQSVPPKRPAMPPPGSVAKAPSRADVEAAAQMSPEEQQAFIRSMVGRLAARMEANPDDPGGWIRLGRAYLVLEETDKAAEALGRAAALWRKELAKLTPGTPEHTELERRIKTLESVGKESGTKP
jgi:cytochrome c-type biogenesis protein CcmH